jgi:hypothetical protein
VDRELRAREEGLQVMEEDMRTRLVAAGMAAMAVRNVMMRAKAADAEAAVMQVRAGRQRVYGLKGFGGGREMQPGAQTTRRCAPQVGRFVHS